MKNNFSYLHAVALFIIMINLYPALQAQQGGPPPPDGHGRHSNQPANEGSALIGGGLILLFSMATVYGAGKRWISQHKSG